MKKKCSRGVSDHHCFHLWYAKIPVLLVHYFSFFSCIPPILPLVQIHFRPPSPDSALLDINRKLFLNITSPPTKTANGKNQTPVERSVRFKLYKANSADDLQQEVSGTFLGSFYDFIDLDPGTVYLLIGQLEGVVSSSLQTAPMSFWHVTRTLAKSDDDVNESGLSRITYANLRDEQITISLESNLPKTFGAEPLARPTIKSCQNINLSAPVEGDFVNPTKTFYLQIESLPYGTIGVDCEQVCAMNYLRLTDPDSGEQQLFEGNSACYSFKKLMNDSLDKRRRQLFGPASAQQPSDPNSGDQTTGPKTAKLKTGGFSGGSRVPRGQKGGANGPPMSLFNGVQSLLLVLLLWMIGGKKLI